MKKIDFDLMSILNDFIKTANLAGIALCQHDINVEFLKAPHIPPSAIPKGKLAAYIFLWNNRCLKVGRVGANSHARYTNQHYNPKSSASNLAKSVLNDCEISQSYVLNEKNVGSWIKKHTDRINLIIDMKHGIPVVALLEAYLQCRLKPMFEGFKSQK